MKSINVFFNSLNMKIELYVVKYIIYFYSRLTFDNSERILLWIVIFGFQIFTAKFIQLQNTIFICDCGWDKRSKFQLISFYGICFFFVSTQHLLFVKVHMKWSQFKCILTICYYPWWAVAYTPLFRYVYKNGMPS